MQCEKIGHIVERLTKHYLPFTLLSSERLPEVPDIIRIFDLKEKEIVQMRGGIGIDYLFVIDGCIDVILDGEIQSLAGPKDAKHRPFLLPGKNIAVTIVAATDCIIVRADRELLDELISWDEMAQITDVDGAPEVRDVMHLVRNSLAFKRLPWEHFEEAIKKMHKRAVKHGEFIVRRGEEADAFYVLTAGSAASWTMGAYDMEPQRQADLRPGDAFGDLSLVSGQPRTRTIQMLEDGELMVLERDVFKELIAKSQVKLVKPSQAKEMLAAGERALLDVRNPEEHGECHIPGSIHIPLCKLKVRMGELDKSKKYIAHCHAGSRSAIATLILMQTGFDVLSLEGGLRDWPYEKEN